MPLQPLPLALYVHIPFCAYRCRYCNFTFETGWSPALMERTLNAIVAEAAELRRQGEADGLKWQISSLYIGGGTPSVVPAPLLSSFLMRLEETLEFSAASLDEATIEANPENVTPDTLAAWAEAGINRLSLGVQTFDSDRLALLGRWCDGPTNRAALSAIATHWKGRWSADLMTGLPGRDGLKPQWWTGLRADLDELLSYEPGHVSLYSLIVEPETELAVLTKNRGVTAPGEDAADQLWLSARQTLLDRGFEWYEISNFARPGHRSRHNQAYWRMDWWAGLGPGAAGSLPMRDAQGNLRPLRTHNPRLFPWLNGQRERVPLSAPEFALEHYVAGWRTSDGVVPGRIDERFVGISPLAANLSDSKRLVLNKQLEMLPDFKNVQFR